MLKDVQEITQETYVQHEIKKFDAAQHGVAEMQKNYLGLKIQGLEDKEGYTIVHDARMDVKAKRISVEKKCKEVIGSMSAAQREVRDYVEKLITPMKAIEDYLTKEEKDFDNEKERIKQEKLRQEAERIAMRIDKLKALGFKQFGDNNLVSDTGTPNDSTLDVGGIPLAMSVIEFESMSEERFDKFLIKQADALSTREAYLSLVQKAKEEKAAAAEKARLDELARMEEERQALIAENKRLQALADEKAAEQRALQESLAKEAQRLSEEKEKIDLQKRQLLQESALIDREREKKESDARDKETPNFAMTNDGAIEPLRKTEFTLPDSLNKSDKLSDSEINALIECRKGLFRLKNALFLTESDHPHITYMWNQLDELCTYISEKITDDIV